MLKSKKYIIDKSTDVYNYNKKGIYFLINKEIVLYVGSSLYINKRIHIHNKNTNINFDRLFIIEYLDDLEMRNDEIRYIQKLTPKYNIKDNPLLIQENQKAINLIRRHSLKVNLPRGLYMSINIINSILLSHGIEPRITSLSPVKYEKHNFRIDKV